MAELQFTVEPRHAIDFADDQMPAVLSTPWLIWFLEHAAREAVLPSLEPDESTVGTHVDIHHLAPTPIGQTVTCQARILHVDGPSVTLQLMAKDEVELIARALHKLRIVQCSRLASRVRAKTRP